MWFAGVSIPLKIYGLVLALCLTVFILFGLAEFEFQMILMRLYSTLWTYLGFDPQKIVHLTLPGRTIRAMPIGYVPFNPLVNAAWQTMMRILFASLVMSAFITAPLTMWYVDFSRKRGKAILQERHERGAMLVTRDILQNEVRAHNNNRFAYECQNLSPPMLPKDVVILNRASKRALGIHQPYKIAGIAYPWRLEQSHTMSSLTPWTSAAGPGPSSTTATSTLIFYRPRPRSSPPIPVTRSHSGSSQRGRYSSKSASS